MGGSAFGGFVPLEGHVCPVTTDFDRAAPDLIDALLLALSELPYEGRCLMVEITGMTSAEALEILSAIEVAWGDAEWGREELDRLIEEKLPLVKRFITEDV